MSSSSPRSTSLSGGAGRTFHLESLGCAKNQVDAELMIAALERAGWARAQGPDDAAVLIVNTCGFISSAKKESIETSLELKARHPEKRLVMTGCLSERYAGELRSELPEIDDFLGAGDPSAIVALLDGPGTSPVDPRPYERIHLLSFPGSAYVKIADGCDNRCTYCAIPLIRGALASRECPDIVQEIKGLLDRGVQELILIAQDLGSFGKDRGGAELPRLLHEIAGLGGSFWVRLLYIHPDHFPTGILDLQRQDPRFLPYYDIPFQHASPKILRAMGRRGDAARNLALLSEIRERVPDAVIRSTFLTGFPGETDEDFDHLLSFQEEARLDWMGVFTYSREEDTPAYRMGPRVTKAVAEKRKQELERRQVGITERLLDAWIGRRMDVLIEEPVQGEELSLGRGFLQAPDVDGLVVVHGTHRAGTLVKTKVLRRNGVDLEAEPFGPAREPFGPLHEPFGPLAEPTEPGRG
jgi:ribosomal protein S12 methylthiotransferase